MELVSCPVCGRKNASDRTTYLSCGASLAVSEKSRPPSETPVTSEPSAEMRKGEGGLKDKLVAFGWLTVLLIFLAGSGALIVYVAVLGVPALYNSWMDGTLDAWFSKPVSNGLIILIALFLGYMLYAIGSELDGLETKLETPFEPVDEKERELWKETLELKRKRRKLEGSISRSYEKEGLAPEWIRKLLPWHSRHYERERTLYRKELIKNQRDLERKQLEVLLGEETVDDALHWPIRVRMSDGRIEPPITTKDYEDYQDYTKCAPMWYYPWSVDDEKGYRDFRENELKKWKRALEETLAYGPPFTELSGVGGKLKALRELYNFACQDKTDKISRPMYEEIEIRKEIVEEERRRRPEAI